MTSEELRKNWKEEENIAHIKGWDFSHINDRYEEEESLPWDYEKIIKEYLSDDMKLLDYDTGGGEFLLSLHHPFDNTAATEGYPPNVELCKERLGPLGIDIRECNDASHIPFNDESFDIIINRHGDFDPHEIKRLLKPGGLFITQQVGSHNDRELVEAVLPDMPLPFPDANLDCQKKAFEKAGFEIIKADEAYGPIHFYDIGAFVWFAHIIEWEFPGFSVDKCFDRLLKLQEIVEREGKISGSIHRYMITARKPDIIIKKMETEEEIKGKAYVHWKAWHEAYPGLIRDEYLNRLTLAKCEQIAFNWTDNLYIAKDGDRVVGFAGYGHRDGEPQDTGEVFALYVLAEYYGKGVGRKLMDAAIKHLRKDYQHICLWTLKENIRAIRFYQKCGFTADGTVKTNTNINAQEIRMTLC